MASKTFLEKECVKSVHNNNVGNKHTRKIQLIKHRILMRSVLSADKTLCPNKEEVY